MRSQRNILFIALVFVSFLLFQKWQNESNPTAQETEQYKTQQDSTLSGSDTWNNTIPNNQSSPSKLITVKTDVLTLAINISGGDVVSAKLNNYAANMEVDSPFILLEQNKEKTYIAQSGLVGPQGIDLSSSSRPVYQIASQSFEMQDGKNELRIPMHYESNNIKYTKTFVLKPKLSS